MSNQISVYVKKNQETNLSSQAQLSVLVPQFKRDGYELSSSWLGSDGKTYTDKISISTDTTISARWKPVEYSISYELDGGENHPDNPTSYTIESETIPLCAATKYQHAFQKWTEDGNEITEISSGSMGDKTLSANFVRSLVTARYHANKPLENQLYFEAQEAGSMIKLQNVAGTYKTSTNGTDWTDYELGTLCTLTNVGDKIYFSARDKNDTCFLNYDIPKFSMTGKIAAEGNIQYLLDSTGECLSVDNRCYNGIFHSCSSLTQAPELPATTLATVCYTGMFCNCTSLSSAPALPATTLAEQCYEYMFSGCSSLTQAPVLSATTLAKGCYTDMFCNCTSLSSAPELPAKTLANYCYNSMFQNCTSLTQAPTLPATTLADGCYYYMFQNCTSLTQAPTLPATTLANYCYNSMFYNCNHLSVTTDSTKQGAYQILSVGSTTVSNWGNNMFTYTAGDFTGTPTTGTPYYCWGN